MSDEFEEMMSREFSPEDFARGNKVADEGLIPPSTDDHTVFHLLEAETQLLMYLGGADEFVCPEVEPEAEGFTHLVDVGMAQFVIEFHEKHQSEGPLNDGSPNSIEFAAWARRAAGGAALALEQFLVVHELPSVIVPVFLSGHGWYPFSIRPGDTQAEDDE